MGIDNNGALKCELPFVGAAGRNKEYQVKTNTNSEEMLNLLRDFGLTALSTHGPKSKPGYTWFHPAGGTGARIDFVITRLAGQPGQRARVDYKAPCRTQRLQRPSPHLGRGACGEEVASAGG